MPPREAPQIGPDRPTGAPNAWEEGAAPPAPAVAERLQSRQRELQALLVAGLISAEEYEALWAKSQRDGPA